jgi:hypothetical protein
MGVRVGQPLVPVRMGMAMARRDWLGMGVAMVLVVLVLVRVLDGPVRMKVRVALCEMQPHAPGHENRSYGEVPGQGLFEESETERGARERRGGEVRPGARGAELAQGAHEERKADPIAHESE